MFNLIIYFGIISITIGSAYEDSSYLTVHKLLVTWREAHLQCRREGGILASPINSEVLKAMKNLMSDDRMYYIGTRAGYSSGTYVSIEGVSLNNMTEVMESMIQELDPEIGDCLAMDHKTVRLVPCWTRLQYICSEKLNIKEYTDDICGPSEYGYKYNVTSKKCFKIHRKVATWDEASSNCTSEDGQLAVIENEKDKAAVMSLYDFPGWYWIFVGLRDYSGRGDWKSVDGRPVSDLFNVWDGGYKPAGDSKPCGAMRNTGNLDNLYCSDSRHFICERKPRFSTHFKV